MTDEIPVERGVRCTECGATVYLTRNGRTLWARCDCGKEEPIKVASKLPEGWE